MTFDIEKHIPINTKDKVDIIIKEMIDNNINFAVTRIKVIQNIRSLKIQLYFDECLLKIKKEKTVANKIASPTKLKQKSKSTTKLSTYSTRKNNNKYTKPIFKSGDFAPRYSSFDYKKIDNHKSMTLIPKKN